MVEEYFSGLLVLATFIALALGVSHPKLKNATSYGAGILLICAILLPLIDILQGFDKEGFVDNLIKDIEYGDVTDDVIELAFENGISEYVADKYSVDKSCVLVMADEFDMESMRAKRIYITLSGEAALLDYKRIEEEVCREFTSGGECEVSLKVG